MEIRLFAGLDQNRDVAEGDPALPAITHQREIVSGRLRADDIVRNHQLRIRKILFVQVDVNPRKPFILFRLQALRHQRMPFAPEPEGADIDEGDVGIAVVPLSGRPQKVAQLRKVNRVVKHGVRRGAVRSGAAGKCVTHHLRPGLLHPARRRILQPVFGGREAESHLLAAGNPALGGRIDKRPAEIPLRRLEEGPGKPQIDDGTPLEPLQRIRRLELRPVMLRQIRIEMHGPAHSRIQQRPAVIPQRHRHRLRGGRQKRAADRSRGLSSYFSFPAG